MTDLACAAAISLEQAAVDQDTGADAVLDGDDD